MSKQDYLEVHGRVVEALPHGIFQVRIETGQIVTAQISGKMRMHYVRIVPGDSVMVEISSYDLTRGRITERAEKQAA